MHVYVMNAAGDDPRFQQKLQSLLASQYPDAQCTTIDLAAQRFAPCSDCHACNAWLVGRCIHQDGLYDVFRDMYDNANVVVWMFPLDCETSAEPAHIALRRALPLSQYWFRKKHAEASQKGEEYFAPPIHTVLITDPRSPRTEARMGQIVQEYGLIFSYNSDWEPI